jgi:hypothetical protein
MEIWQTRGKGALSYSTWSQVGELNPHLVLVFGGITHFRREGFAEALRDAFPSVPIIGCSTAGEITRDGVMDDQIVLTAMKFHTPNFRIATTSLESMDDSKEAGRRLGDALLPPSKGQPLRSLLLFGQGVQVNGSAIVQGIAEQVGTNIPVSGALAGDGGAFTQTYTVSPEGISSRRIVSIGFYGDSLQVRTGSAGGWLPFGPVRRITRASHNILFELDGEPALDIYRRYLGDWAKKLPESGLLFPICLLDKEAHETGLIRTLLGIDESSRSLILAGDVTEQTDARFMHADTKGLLDGAKDAVHAALGDGPPADLALLFSCVGRKLVLGGRVDQEIEAVADSLSDGTVLAGFYSNGEIGPHKGNSGSRLHNQTMTVTLLSERT